MHSAYVELRDGAVMPEYKTPGSAAFDIAVIEDAVIPVGATKMLRTGLIIRPPEGYWTAIFNRSSNFKRGVMLANNVGVVDPDFCGPEDEYRLTLYNFSQNVVRVEKGDRLAQGLFLPLYRPLFHQTVFEGPSRGGWGSTGTK